MSIDLHTHSSASDGALSPAALVEHVAACGVTTLALTDHDTLAGLAPARAAAGRAGLRLINGIELSVSWRGRTLHVVGLDFDSRDPGLCQTVDQQSAARAGRAEAIGQRLARAGLHRASERAHDLAAGGQITRAHFARLLVADDMAAHTAAAFKRFLKPGRPGHVKADWISLSAAIESIQAAGGSAVLAHPFGYGFSHAWRDRALRDFAAAGGQALEIVTGTTDVAQERQALLDATAYGLRASKGSDFHAPAQFWLAPGRLRPLPETIPHVACID